jgi:hypothetical protein
VKKEEDQGVMLGRWREHGGRRCRTRRARTAGSLRSLAYSRWSRLVIAPALWGMLAYSRRHKGRGRKGRQRRSPLIYQGSMLGRGGGLDGEVVRYCEKPTHLRWCRLGRARMFQACLLAWKAGRSQTHVVGSCILIHLTRTTSMLTGHTGTRSL